MKEINVAVIGATGIVGMQALRILEERGLNIKTIYPFASGASAGNIINFGKHTFTVEELCDTSFEGKDIDFALFCASNDISAKFVPIAAAKGIICIDNSSHFRADPTVPLVVPEVNAHALKAHKNIIANPNCTTVQAVMLLAPLHKKYGLKRVIVTTFQAVSGAGKEGIIDLTEGYARLSWQTSRIKDALTDPNHVMNPLNILSPVHQYPLKAMPTYIAGNLIPAVGDIDEEGYSSEERKIVNESRKILELSELSITATCVRVPVINGHSESLNIELEKDFEIKDVIKTLEQAEGVALDDRPMPMKVNLKDPVFVGRVRRDNSANGVNLFSVTDNIRKGAALNAVQILEVLL